jgi:hypothetical protein
MHNHLFKLILNKIQLEKQNGLSITSACTVGVSAAVGVTAAQRKQHCEGSTVSAAL